MEAARHRMVESAIRGAGVTDEAVLRSMRTTERHEFVPDELRDRAYVDAGLPIGEGQTISSPFIVAYMTQALEPRATDRVLEIGTGSGYQAAVLSPLVQDVYSIEIVEPLGKRAAEVLGRLGYDNVHTKVGDGYLGWEEHAPFDKIVVTCSPENVPAPLVEQLAEGGMVVIPVGERHQQVLFRMVKKDGALVATPLRPTLFVPMTGAAEERRRVLPDAARPALLNPDFEDGVDETLNLRGWYYQRRMRLVESADAPSGQRYVEFSSDAPGQPAHAMQALAIDGREVSRLDFRAMMASTGAREGAHREEVPTAGLTFYDGDRVPLDTVTLGPMLGTNDWQERVRHHIHVPTEAREAIVRIGLFGATGTVSFDDVQLFPVDAAGRLLPGFRD
ncbi:Protein-L-isoaspartate O-methyltransferase [Planctomycetes bacterium Poly30]|uniref:Protein-L-isoaspartate O-methyltransferase n=2 Tax=Saltatorellus ferox TaxID=2528018 RepID=A0A518F0Q0_9BACT|nr:Protein-L-isoaspartate O-methyltransferase [Planctomycetes bacterium Poly30]